MLLCHVWTKPRKINCWSSCVLVIAYSSKAMGEADIGASFLETASVLIDLTEDNGFFCPSRFHSPLYSHIDGWCQVYWVTVFYTRVFALSAHQTLHLHWPAMEMHAVNVRSHAIFYKKLIFTCNKRQLGGKFFKRLKSFFYFLLWICHWSFLS